MTQKLIIDRNKWLRGEGGYDSALLRKSDGKMCCLGFYGKQCGISEKEMEDKGEYADCWDLGNNILSKLDGLVESIDWGFTTTIIHDDLMCVNDDENLSEEEREKKIKELFSKVGVDVEFVE